MQKFLTLMKTELAPIENARKSVIEVMVIAIPLVLIMKLIRSETLDFSMDSASAIPDIKIKTSSIPIPKNIEMFKHFQEKPKHLDYGYKGETDDLENLLF